MISMKVEWSVPKKAIVVSGSAEGETELNAFDNALLKAGLGNANLVRVSSVVPKGTVWIERIPSYAVGTIIPTVYASVTSSVNSEEISAAVGIGIDDEGKGLIYEYSGVAEKDEAVGKIRSMVVHGFDVRGWRLVYFKYGSASYLVKDKPACAMAAVAFFL